MGTALLQRPLTWVSPHFWVTGDAVIERREMGLDEAEAVLTLRAVISNEEYRRFHRECEHQPLYPGVKQGQYTLGA